MRTIATVVAAAAADHYRELPRKSFFVAHLGGGSGSHETADR
jgi:hypothetical protein